jgi:hypothetical protein
MERRLDDSLDEDDIKTIINNKAEDARTGGGEFSIDEGRVVENDRVLVYEINDGDVTLTVDGE